MSTESIIGIVAGVIGMVTGVSGMIVSFHSAWMTRYDTARKFLEVDSSFKIRAARKYIYDNWYLSQSDEALAENEKYAIVCNHYQFYGLLTSKGYIPEFVFEDTNIQAIVQCYNCCKRYIDLRRKTRPGYALYFEWLYNKMLKKYARKNGLPIV